MKNSDDDRDQTIGNLLGLIAAALLIVFSLLILFRLEHFVVRRDCYVQGIHVCASIGRGRSPHF